tara:strand:+ start:26 stop:265 length:240 start_codon:yes stop_codon:yes gene_type:complete
MNDNYALKLLIQKRDQLQKNIDDTDDVSGLEDWYLRTRTRIHSLNAAIACVSDVSSAVAEMTGELQALQQRLNRYKRNY